MDYTIRSYPQINTLIRDDNLQLLPTRTWKALLPLRNNTIHVPRVCIYISAFSFFCGRKVAVLAKQNKRRLEYF
jgi:hypothetical protein